MLIVLLASLYPIQKKHLNCYKKIYLEQKRYKNAIFRLEQVYKLAVENGYRANVSEISKIMADTYAKVGDYRKAYDMHVSFKEISDSMLNKNRNEEITRLDIEHSFGDLDKVIEFENLQ